MKANQPGTHLTDFLFDQCPVIARCAAAKKRISWEEHALFGFIFTREHESHCWSPTISYLAREFGTSRSHVRRMIEHLTAADLLKVTALANGFIFHTTCQESTDVTR